MTVSETETAAAAPPPPPSSAVAVPRQPQVGTGGPGPGIPLTRPRLPRRAPLAVAVFAAWCGWLAKPQPKVVL